MTWRAGHHGQRLPVIPAKAGTQGCFALIGIAKEVFHANQPQMHAKHADLSVPLAPTESADPICVLCVHLLLIRVNHLTLSRRGGA